MAGWHRVTAIEGSAQWVEVAIRREAFWRDIMDKGAKGSIRDLLGENSPPKPAHVDHNQGRLF